MYMRNITFLIDGFNLYHAIQDGQNNGDGCQKWLDIRSLCLSYLSAIGGNLQLQNIFYFTALATHLNRPDTVFRHQSYIRCLTDTGVTPIYGRFKPKTVRCPLCHAKFTRYEEKETDVSIAVKLMELLCSNSVPQDNQKCDVLVLITGDTDIAPAVRTAMKLSADTEIWFAFPPWRKNRELSNITGKSLNIKAKNLSKHQFPDPYIHSDGTIINKPSEWA